jgi:maltooligosyltrehalose trehalohydrolase
VTGPNRLGAVPGADGTRFEVWAPDADTVDVELDAGAGTRSRPLERIGGTGTWVAIVDGVGHGHRYRFRLDGGEALADPASGWQPDGVHGPSAVVDATGFPWTDQAWAGVTLADSVLYELHVGTFTPAGTLDSAAEELPRLAELGITSVELMPLNAFPGTRNWGYDGVFPSAVQHSYGGPEALARFVDAAHAVGVGVVVDVVYNHLGPEGNVFGKYGPYLTDAYRTPWGDAINVAEAHSDNVRRTFIESATRWIEDFHVDGLRLDAIDMIFDPTASSFLEELATAVHASGAAVGRPALLFAETASNDPGIVRPPSLGGVGCDAAWNDDVHHALRVALTGDRHGYYVDYDGIDDLVTAFAHRWVFGGRYSPYRGRRHGRSADDVPAERFVVFSSNHDHVGNTPAGARPALDQAQRILAAATIVLSPFTPMLFMGEEYGEPAPFPYFVDHGDTDLLEAVRVGRRNEFARSEWTATVADPAARETFVGAVLDPSQAETPPHRETLAAYTELIALRRRHAVVHHADAGQQVERHDDAMVVARTSGDTRSVLAVNLGPEPVSVTVDGELAVAFDSRDARWGGAGQGVELTGGRLTLDGLTAALLVGPGAGD